MEKKIVDAKLKLLIATAVVLVLLAGVIKKYSNTFTEQNPILPLSPHHVNLGAIDPSILLQNTLIATKTPPSPVVVAPKPLISAEAYLVENLDTGEIYNSHNPSEVFPIASLSKLVVALVVIHNMQLDQKITITQAMLDAGYGDAGHLVAGETLTASELLDPLLLESSNDAAEAFAQAYGYDAFMAKMNSFVTELGMKSTSFKDPSGISPQNVSNTKDLFILAQYIYEHEKPLLALTRQTRVELATTTDHGAHVFNTINPFAFDPHFIGGKTGRTDEAKESMISLFDYVSGNVTYPVAIIVLRSDFSEREIDSSTLFEQFMAKIDKQSGTTVANP